MFIKNSNGSIPSFPITLGEYGRGRWGQKIRRDRRYQGEDIGYILAEGLVVITNPQKGQEGGLVITRTNDGYKKDGRGGSKCVGGEALNVASGKWAFGLAGKAGMGSDELWHVPIAAIIESSTSTGKKFFTFIYSEKGYVKEFTREEACQSLILDDDPILNELCLRLDNPPKWIKDSLDIKGEIEDSPVIQEGLSEREKESLELVNIKPSNTCMFGGVVDGVLVPGNKKLVIVSVGNGGGKRYDYKVTKMEGLEVFAEYSPFRCASKTIYALAEGEWIVESEEYKDNSLTGKFKETSKGRAEIC
jgi:hypothetical protein